MANEKVDEIVEEFILLCYSVGIGKCLLDYRLLYATGEEKCVDEIGRASCRERV